MKVNWENAPEDAMYAAQDSDGSIKFYEAKPHPNEHSWSAENGDTWYAFGEVSDWRNSLTARNSCDPSQKNESKQIEEVMALVDCCANACEHDLASTYHGQVSPVSAKAAREAIEAKLCELLPEGFVLVPVLPTEAMLKAAVMNAEGDAVYKSLEERWLKEEEQKYGDVYCAMLSAAPKAPE